MTDSERLAAVREIITKWNFGPWGLDAETLFAIWEIVGDNQQRECVPSDFEEVKAG